MATIPTIGSFDPPDTKAEEGDLAAESGYIQAHGGRIIGRGTDVVSQMRTSAVEFTELVAAPLAREGGKFEGAAHTAMQGAVYGSMVTNQWATWVTEFKAARQALIDEWEAAVADSFGIRESEVGDGTPNLTPTERADAAEEATAYAGQLKLAEMNEKAATLYEKFKGQASDIGGMLRGGQTPENLRALAAGGVGTWMGFNVFGLDMALPVTGQDGQDLVDALNAAMKNGEPLSPELREQLETLVMVAQRAGNLQDLDDAELTAGELGFLQVLFGALDTHDNGETGRLYDIAGLLEESGFSKDDQQFALTALGGGLIALSNPRVGGGTERLPDPVRRIVDIYAGRNDDSRHPKALLEMLNGLAPMLGATGREVTVDGEKVSLDGLKAGREFSTALVYSVADIVDSPKFAPKLHPTEMMDLDRVIGGVMEVATRDLELNSDLLTGQVKHPVYGDDSTEHLLRGVFGRNWEDDGKAAAKLIDWIPGALNGSDPFLEQRAAESYVSLVNTMTSEEVNGSWKDSAFTFFTDGYGKIGGFDSAPIGMANPHVAQALASSTVPFLDWYADGDDKIEVDGEMVERDTAINWSLNPDKRGVYFNMTDRAHMFELIMGSKDAANTLGEAVYAKIYLDGYNLPKWADGDGHADLGLPGGGDGEGAEMYAKRSGRLLGFLQAGYDAVHTDGAEDAEGVTASNKQESAWIRAGAAVAKEIITTHPAFKIAKPSWDLLVKEAFEVGKWGPNVTETQGWAFGSADAPGSNGKPMTLENINTFFGHNIVDGLTSDPGSGRTLAELREHDPNLVVEDEKTGEWRMKTPKEIEDQYDSLSGSDYSLDDALNSYRQFLGPGNTTRYNEYVRTLDDIAEEYRENHAR